MNGNNGFNVRDWGLSRENIMAHVAALAPRYMLIQDTPTLAALCASIGIRVIYRASGDDPAHEPLKRDPGEFVAERARAAPGAAYIHLTNEVDPPNADLHRWTREAMNAADRLKRKVCIYNYGTNKSRAQWLEGIDNLRRAAAGGHAIGAHFYSDYGHDEGGLDFLSVKEEVGGLWCLTEMGYIRSIFDANHGWRGAIGVGKYQALMDKWSRFFCEHGIPLLWFSYDQWQATPQGRSSGFGLEDTPELLQYLNALNRRDIHKEVPVTPPTVPSPIDGGVWAIVKAMPAGVSYRNIRTQPRADSPDMGDLRVGDRVMFYPNAMREGWVYIDGEAAAGWVLASGIVWESVTQPPGYTVTSEQWQAIQTYLGSIQRDAAALRHILEEVSVPPSERDSF